MCESRFVPLLVFMSLPLLFEKGCEVLDDAVVVVE